MSGTFLPCIEFCELSDDFHRGADVLRLKPGQWVSCKGVKGRVTDSETLRIPWRHAGESFRSFNLRFKKALSLRKGIKTASGALRGVVQARKLMQLQFTDSEPGVMSRAVLSAHQRLAALRVQYQACEKGKLQ